MFSMFTHVMKPVRDTNSEPGLPVVFAVNFFKRFTCVCYAIYKLEQVSCFFLQIYLANRDIYIVVYFITSIDIVTNIL